MVQLDKLPVSSIQLSPRYVILTLSQSLDSLTTEQQNQHALLKERASVCSEFIVLNTQEAIKMLTENKDNDALRALSDCIDRSLLIDSFNCEKQGRSQAR
ncbi:hypothetical protein RLOatenuis_0400 [Rickettsiales bacterium]|nr:hypothetical protein RLOatenuis_0400 [Rickettsiales bacterium]